MTQSSTPFMHFAQCLRAQAAIILIAIASPVFAQAETVYRCPVHAGITAYTNDKAEADAKRCIPMTGGNLTVVQGTKVQTAPEGKGSANGNGNASPPVKVANAPQAGGRGESSSEQRVRDSDSRMILESELKKAESKQAELLREYNNGEPEKRSDETRNHQKYIDRVAELKASIARNDSDIAGIKREIGRMPTKVSGQ
jgi:hypothetical protein